MVGEPPQLVVDKTDHDVDILEAADDIAYDITITNISLTEPLTITSITDAVTFVPKGGAPESRGELVVDENGIDDAGLVGVDLVSTDCDAAIGTVLATTAVSTTCTITLRFTGNADDRYEDKVTVDAVRRRARHTPPPPTRLTRRSSTLPRHHDRQRPHPGLGAGDRRSGRLHVDRHQRQLRQRRPGDDHGALRQRLRQLLPRGHGDGVIDTTCFGLENVVLELPG